MVTELGYERLKRELLTQHLLSKDARRRAPSSGFCRVRYNGPAVLWCRAWQKWLRFA